jgi:hypothetical protein
MQMLGFKTYIENTTDTVFKYKRGYQSCNSFTLYDKTGDYSSINPTGWGFPNITRASVTYLNLITFNPITGKPFIPTPPSTATYDLVGTSFLTVGGQIEITYSLITGGQQTGDLPNGLYVLWINSVQGATALSTVQICIQPCEIVCELNKLSDKILYTKACCETIEKYKLLSDTFMALNYEMDCLNRYFKELDVTSETYSEDITGTSVYKKVNNLYKKCMALVNGKGGCGCGCK